MDLTLFHTWWTVLLVVVFIGIVLWSWSGRRKASFDAAARLPLDDDKAFSILKQKKPGVKKHG